MKYLTSAELAARLGCQPNTLAAWRCEGKGPPYLKFGKTMQSRVRYSEAAVEDWEGKSHYQNTSSY